MSTTLAARVSSVVDDIDRLVDDSLTAGEHISDYLTGDHAYPRCPHCGRHWHGLRITVRIAAMYGRGQFDETYSTGDDKSPVLCEGSNFIGPQLSPVSWPVIQRVQWGAPLVIYPMIGSNTLIETSLDALPGGLSQAMREMATRAMVAMQDLLANVLAFELPQLDEAFNLNSWFSPPPAPPRALTPPERTLPVTFGPENWVLDPMVGDTSWKPYLTLVEHRWPELTAPRVPTAERPGIDFDAISTHLAASTGPGLRPLGRR